MKISNKLWKYLINYGALSYLINYGALLYLSSRSFKYQEKLSELTKPSCSKLKEYNGYTIEIQVLVSTSQFIYNKSRKRHEGDSTRSVTTSLYLIILANILK